MLFFCLKKIVEMFCQSSTWIDISVFKKFKETGIFDEKEVYPYLTEGIGEDILPKNVDFNLIDHFEKVNDKDGAIRTMAANRNMGPW